MKKKGNNEFWQDDLFIRYMLASDEVSAEYWNRYLKDHPEEREAFEEARESFRNVKLNDYSLPEETCRNLLNDIHRSYDLQKKKKNRYYLYGTLVAACLTGILFLISVLYTNNFSGNQDVLVELPSSPSDSIPTEVTLITNTSEKIELENNSVIACDSSLYIQDNQGQKDYLSRSTDKKEEKTTYNTLIVPRGKRSTLQLADGSKIWVNAGTVLKFPSVFAFDKRVIRVEGEIYIEVARDETKPFFVETPEFSVNVLGTCFNVSAYSDEAVHSVVLVKGQVAVKTDKAKEFKLIPNQKLTLSPEKNEIVPVDVYDYISWKDGTLRFKGETATDVLNRLARYYNVEMKCAPSVAEKRCSGELMLFDDIEQVLKTLSILYDVSYRMEGDTILIE